MRKAAKILLIAGFILQCSFDVTAQDQTKKDRILQKFSLTPQVGLLRSWSDFNDEGIGGLFNQTELGGSLLLNYRLNKIISISTGALFGQLTDVNDGVNTRNARNSDADLGFGILYRTNLFEFTLPRVDVNITRLIFKDKSNFFNKVSFNLIGSHGLVFSDSKIYAQGDEDLNLIYDRRRGRSGETTGAVTSYGLGVSYIINDRFDIGVESTIRNVWHDVLDAWKTEGSANDKYSFTAIGVTYHLKKRRDVVKKFKAPEPAVLAEEEKVEEKKEETAELVEEEVAEVKEKVEDKKEEIVPLVEEKKEEIVEKKEEVVVPVVEKKKEAVAELVEKKKETVPVKEGRTVSAGDDSDLTIYEGGGNFIAVAAFRGLQGSKRMVDQLKSKGENPVVIRNKKDTWYIITIARYDDKEVALGKMQEARTKGYERAWVHIK